MKVFGECYEIAYDGLLEDLKLQETEVECVMAMSVVDLQRRIHEKPDGFLPDSLYAIRQYFENQSM